MVEQRSILLVGRRSAFLVLQKLIVLCSARPMPEKLEIIFDQTELPPPNYPTPEYLL